MELQKEKNGREANCREIMAEDFPSNERLDSRKAESTMYTSNQEIKFEK